MGDLTAFNWDDQRFWLMGSYYLRQWHMRWFADHLPKIGATVRDISDEVVGIAIAGPKSRELISRLTPADMSQDAFRFLSAAALDVGPIRVKVGRLSVVGELGYEFNVGRLSRGRFTRRCSRLAPISDCGRSAITP